MRDVRDRRECCDPGLARGAGSRAAAEGDRDRAAGGSGPGAAGGAGGSGDISASERIGRRRLLTAAVFPPRDQLAAGHAPDGDPAPDGDHGFPDAGRHPRAVAGTIVDVSPQVIVIGDARSEQRFTLTAAATAWRGGMLEPAALGPGGQAVIRLVPGKCNVADRIWADIGRVTGTIIERGSSGLLVDEGSTRERQVVVIPRRAAGRIQVRFPTLEPGYLLDVIGVRRAGLLEALLPATSQPTYRADRMPTAALVSGHLPDTISGSASWHDPAGEPDGVRGARYPAVDPQSGCAEEAAGPWPQGFIRMPYLAVGSVLQIRNDCCSGSERAAAPGRNSGGGNTAGKNPQSGAGRAGRPAAGVRLPVTGCAPVARLFNDRCLTCGTSPRGRVADLTLASFVALGGELERGCFNATITVGR